MLNNETRLFVVIFTSILSLSPFVFGYFGTFQNWWAFFAPITQVLLASKIWKSDTCFVVLTVSLFESLLLIFFVCGNCYGN